MSNMNTRLTDRQRMPVLEVVHAGLCDRSWVNGT